jgi:hypothetical protein
MFGCCHGVGTDDEPERGREDDRCVFSQIVWAHCKYLLMRTLVKVLLRLQLRDGHAIPRRPDGMDHRLGAP